MLGMTGDQNATALHSAKDAGFFELKGALESLASHLLRYEPFRRSTQIPRRGWSAAVERPMLLGGKPVATFGELAIVEREARKLRQPVWLASVDLAALYSLPLRTATARDLSRFQPVERDFSFTFPDATSWGDVSKALDGLRIVELTRVAPAEIFRDAKGAAVPKGHYALLVRCTFQSADRTLREDEMAEWSGQVVSA